MPADLPDVSPRDLTVAVVGATGAQGGATARALLESGAAVRALTRHVDSSAARELADRGAEVVGFDLDDVASVRSAFDGADRVFAMATMTDRGVDVEIEHGRTMAQAAADTGVELLVYSSVGGAERHTGVPHFESKRRIEERILELGVPSVFVRPVFFMENLLGAASVEEGHVVVRLPLPDGVPLQMIAVSDIGAVSAVAVTRPDRVGSSIEIAGDERTGSEMAQAFASRAGLPGRYEALPLSALDGDEDQRAMFSWFAGGAAYRADFAATRDLVPDVESLGDWVPRSGWKAG